MQRDGVLNLDTDVDFILNITHLPHSASLIPHFFRILYNFIRFNRLTFVHWFLNLFLLSILLVLTLCSVVNASKIIVSIILLISSMSLAKKHKVAEGRGVLIIIKCLDCELAYL